MSTHILEESSKTNSVFDCHEEFDSSAVAEAWYSTSQRNLVVRPVDGDRFYQYLNVPRAEWDAFVNSSSPGAHWSAIRSRYGHTEPLKDSPELVTDEDQTQAYTVTVQVHGAFEISVKAATISDALSEAEADLKDKFQASGLDYDILGVVKE